MDLFRKIWKEKRNQEDFLEMIMIAVQCLKRRGDMLDCLKKEDYNDEEEEERRRR